MTVLFVTTISDQILAPLLSLCPTQCLTTLGLATSIPSQP